MERRKLKVKLLTISIVLIMLVGIVPQAAFAGQVMEENNELFPRPFDGYNLDTIYIFYDPTDEILKSVGEGVEELLSFRLNGVKLIPIQSYQQMQGYLIDGPWIAIYALQSDLDSVNFLDEEISWKHFYSILNDFESTEHVVGMANTLSLDPFIKSTDIRIHHSQSEVEDALILLLYDMWSVSELAKRRSHIHSDYLNASRDLEKMTLEVYADHFNEIFQRSIEPVDAIGEANPLAAEERHKKMIERNPAQIEEAAYIRTEEGELVPVDPENLPEDFNPAIALTTAEDVDSNSFILGELPFLSGLRGPIGKIVDVLLDLLKGAGKTVLSIPTDAIESIKDIFETIQPYLGIVSDFDAESPLKSLISAIADEFPFPANLKSYLEPILKALFNLRGDLSSIVDVIMELVQGLLPEVIPTEVMSFLDDVLDIGGGLWDMVSDVISNGKGAFDTILSFLTNNVMEALLNKTLVATLGISGDISNLINRGVAFIQSTIGYLSSLDFTKFIEDIGDNLLNSALGLLDNAPGQEVFQKIMSVVKMGFSVVDLIDKFDADSLMEIVAELVQEFAGASNIIGEAQDFAEKLLNVTKQFSEGLSSGLSNFRNQITSLLTQYLKSAVPESTRTLITDAMAMITGFFHDGFDPSALPNIFDIAEGLLNDLGLDTSTLNSVVDAMNNAVKPILGIIATVTDSDALKKMIANTVSQFASSLGNFQDIFKTALKYLDLENVFGSIPNLDDVLGTFGNIAGGIMTLVGSIRDQSFEGIMNSLLVAVSSIVGTFPSFDDVPIDAMLNLVSSFFPEAFSFLSDIPSPAEAINQVLDMAQGLLSGIIDIPILEDVLGLLGDVSGIFTDGIQWLLGKAYDWLTGQLTPLLEQLESMINGAFGGLSDLLGFAGDLPIGLGEWSLFVLSFDLGIEANFHINPTPFFEFVRSILFEGRSPFNLASLGEFFKVLLSFFEISPQFRAELGVSGFDSSKNDFMQYLLGFLGLEISFSGYAKFVLTLFTFREGMFQWEDFFKIVEWVLSLDIAMSKTITLLDLITGGVGGGVLSKLASYIGLDAIKISIWLGLELDIIKKAATAVAAETSTLSFILTLGAAVSLGIDIIVASAKLTGSLEIILSFFQDFASASPMKIVLSLVLTLKLKIKFLWSTWKKTWTWQPGGPWDLSPNKGDPEYENSGVGFDSDGDGLSDDYESTIPGLDPYSADTDNDGASDKLEVQTMGSDPTVPDTDGDNLLDGEEWDLGTNPMRPDSDWDGTDDYNEVKVYNTDPLSQDTDGDGLSDTYEIETSYNMSSVWVPPGTEIIVYIGGTAYTDHTDPLVADTDGDTIVDGDEGVTGAYYGTEALYNDTEETEGSGDWVMDPNPLIFNNGFTHPLDPDTDDDSWYQLYNGDVDTQLPDYYLMDMNDGVEIAGFWIIVYDDEGEPENKQVFTNPCNPDTDGDTGVTDRTPQPGAWLNSDGYELAQTPPTDPTDGDSDDDGLLDGLEGVLAQFSNHTNANDADTDDDGLFDMQEILLGTDPRSQDSDFDMISDGDEFYIFFTDPMVFDSDQDGVSDGEEVYFFHSNPMIDDSDGDGITDGDEILKYLSDPMDEDSDNDGLTDFEEIFIYYTSPFTYDTDGDNLSDGSEVKEYGTDPLNWDTDADSITEPNEYGEMTFPMSDYHEVMIYPTDPTMADTDSDGLSDSLELYLGSGLIPWMDPIPLDPTSNDTDQDWLVDGSELLMQNVSGIIYPYVAIFPVLRFNTSPTVMDTDNDTLTDYQEVMVFNSEPDQIDTDNDTIPDWWEIWVYNTSAIYNDTDGDGLEDQFETLQQVWPYGDWPPTNWSIGLTSENESAEITPYYLAQTYTIPDTATVLWDPDDYTPMYPTGVLNPDSDADWLPDGSEIQFYGSNPMDSDSDGDGIADTYEFDSDFDSLSDGMEFKLGLQTAAGGGIFNPDSDRDGLMDGVEYYEYGTDPLLADTDSDGYGDGLEVMVGTDPLSYTSKEEFEIHLATQRGLYSMKITIPVEGAEAFQNTQITVINYTDFQDMYFRYNNGSGWSENITMEYYPPGGVWTSIDMRWNPGEYEVQVFGLNNTGIIHAQTVHFTVQPGDDPWLLYLIAGIAVAGVTIVSVGYVGHRKGWWSRLKEKVRPGDDKGKKSTKKKETKSKKKTKKSKKKSGPDEGDKGGA
ncbi:MAG: hypothetical protein GF411_19875 [Candidatus Lokiarchaeota archaeon]|nr:hypothetical protein [Candidatus Lokiarchaeota archaeon]